MRYQVPEPAVEDHVHDEVRAEPRAELVPPPQRIPRLNEHAWVLVATAVVAPIVLLVLRQP